MCVFEYIHIDSHGYTHKHGMEVDHCLVEGFQSLGVVKQPPCVVVFSLL